jgi:D-alanyl-D-alanine dipeptidase
VDVGLRRAGDAPARPDWADATDCTVRFDARTPETGLDLGTAFDCFSARSGQGAAVGAEALANRAILTQAMTAEGFVGYAREWWHFRNATDPARRAQDFAVR